MIMNSFRKARGGFTLIELLVVIAIISLLSSIVLASLGQTRAKARDSKRIQDLVQLRNALEEYALDNNGLYPVDPTDYPNDSRGLSCWDCDNSFVLGYFLDNNRLSNLQNYLNPRPFDPSLSSASAKFVNGSGYWYKVSASRRNYKLAILGSIENLNSIPISIRDESFNNSPFHTVSPVPPPSNNASIYSSEAKGWRFFTQVSCSALGDC